MPVLHNLFLASFISIELHNYELSCTRFNSRIPGRTYLLPDCSPVIISSHKIIITVLILVDLSLQIQHFYVSGKKLLHLLRPKTLRLVYTHVLTCMSFLSLVYFILWFLVYLHGLSNLSFMQFTMMGFGGTSMALG